MSAGILSTKGTRRKVIAREQDVMGLVTQRIAVGLSSAIELVPIQFQEGWLFKYPVVGGTLEICGSTGIPTQFTAGMTQGQGMTVPVQTWGAGYMVEVGESISIDGPARFYLRSTGATSVIHVIRTLTAGYQG